MRRLQQNLAKKTNNFEDIDKQYAYAIWIIEKEFHVGSITQEFPMLKFWNLMDKDNADKYKRDTDPKRHSDGGMTFR